ncbi:MAG: hypothetical protein JWM12_3818 [Ilumatobacteraceae bacterium]|nr:hypothetical protein [Ilumatobacteraceae bacterium]
MSKATWTVRRGVRWGIGASLIAGCAALVGPITAAHADAARAATIEAATIQTASVHTEAAAGPTPEFIPASADWLTSVNYYRSMSGLGPVTEDPALATGATNHSCYMLTNGISHDETPGSPGYTAAGDESGNNSNVAVSSAINATPRSFVELWMTGPYHAIGILRPGLTTTAFGRCDQSTTPTWHAAATLDVLHGLTNQAAPAQPILFPGAGSTTNLNRFVVESPNPLDACGWTGSAGLPVLAMLPEAATGANATITGPNGPIETCTVSGANTTGTAQQLLTGANAVVAIPRNTLADGTYHVTVHTNGRNVAWDFTVDQTATNGNGGAAPVTTPAANATPIGAPSGFQPVTPARIVDTRSNLGATPFQAGAQQRIQVTGTAGVPAGATAVVANITATEATSAGFVTLWNCAGARPNASTLNYQAGQNIPNSATIPLDSAGGICASAYAPTQLIIDVTGFDAPTASGHYNPLTPTRVMDTRQPLGPSARLNAGQTVELNVTGTAGVPAGATAVVLNVTSDNASTLGVVTVYPCGTRPTASNLNPAPGETHANLVTTAVSPTGTICIYTLQPTELIVDVTGYFAGPGTTLTATTPFRFTDTRDANPALNNSRGAVQLQAGQIIQIPMAGVRGIAANARAISANITATGATTTGWITAWPCTAGTSSSSNINYGAADPVANAAQLTLSPGGTICILSYSNVDVIIDVNGWWA